MHPRGYKGVTEIICKWGDVQVKGRRLTLLFVMHYFNKSYKRIIFVLKRSHRFGIQFLFHVIIAIMVHLSSLLTYSVHYSY